MHGFLTAPAHGSRFQLDYCLFSITGLQVVANVKIKCYSFIFMEDDLKLQHEKIAKLAGSKVKRLLGRFGMWKGSSLIPRMAS